MPMSRTGPVLPATAMMAVSPSTTRTTRPAPGAPPPAWAAPPGDGASMNVAATATAAVMSAPRARRTRDIVPPVVYLCRRRPGPRGAPGGGRLDALDDGAGAEAAAAAHADERRLEVGPLELVDRL